MKKFNLCSLLSVLFFLVFSSHISSAQTVAGKIFTKEEADNLFGPVVQSVKISASQLQQMLSQTGDYLMFRFEGTSLYILNSKRSALYSSVGSLKSFSAADVMKVYSTSVIKELLNKGQSDTITIEERQSVMSVTDGDYTMEYALGCPPVCP
jgi:hypothetical protein